MAINLICPECHTNLSTRTKICTNCGYEFKNAKKYRVVVKDQSEKRNSKVRHAIIMEKKDESKLKTQIPESILLGIMKAPHIDEVWQKYLAWAKVHKKSWKDDEKRWKCHIEKHLAGKKMDAITGFDVQRVVNGMKAKRNYAPAKIKHVP